MVKHSKKLKSGSKKKLPKRKYWVLVGVILFLILLPTLFGINTGDMNDLWISVLFAISEKKLPWNEPVFVLSNANCQLMDIAGEGPRVFKLEMSGQVAGPVGTTLTFFGPIAPPVKAEKACANWSSCIRADDEPLITTWTASATGIPEDFIVPGYSAEIIAKMSKDSKVTEESFTVPCGKSYNLFARALGEVPNAGGSLSTKPPIEGCENYCQAKVLEGDTITFYATPDEISFFKGWYEDCDGTPKTKPCVLVMDSDKDVTAMFGELTRRVVPTTPVGGGGSKVNQNANGSVSYSYQCRYVGPYGINLSE